MTDASAPNLSPPEDATNSSGASPGLPGFFRKLASIVNSGQSRSVILAGQVHDLFYSETADPDSDGSRPGAYVPLIDFLCDRCRIDGLLLLVYELNGPIRLMDSAGNEASDGGWQKLKQAWVAWKAGIDHDQLILRALTDKDLSRQRERLESDFDRNVQDVIGRPTVALEFLRQLTLCSRSRRSDGSAYLNDQLLVFVEGADLMLPAGNGDIGALPPADRHRVAIVQDWFADPGFMNGGDTVVLLAESASLIHPRVAKLPPVLSVDVDAPDEATRLHYIERFLAGHERPAKRSRSIPEGADQPIVKLWAGPKELARFAAGLSIHALRQLLLAAEHRGDVLMPDDVIGQVESFISSQLGEDVIEFKKPAHSLDDVIGASRLRSFIREELIPRFKSDGPDALPGAAVSGPIGGGKTFIFEAVASSLDLPVLVLKNIRSQWFGQTDVVFERLRRVLESLGKVVIFVDEADTQFGSVGPQTHNTERRLTGKIQQMMSDPKLRGKVIWLLMTARIHRLSPDIRRPGRVGDLIIPVLDPLPGSDDRRAFVRWMLGPELLSTITEDELNHLDESISVSSAAGFASLRSRLKARATDAEPLTAEGVLAIARDQLTPDIAATRRYQTLQALVNCTRRSLLPDPEVDEAQREAWLAEINELERRGIT
ncbi:MAG: ATP-binding protein [Planctomycetota bacterium]